MEHSEGSILLQVRKSYTPQIEFAFRERHRHGGDRYKKFLVILALTTTHSKEKSCSLSFLFCCHCRGASCGVVPIPKQQLLSLLFKLKLLMARATIDTIRLLGVPLGMPYIKRHWVFVDFKIA